MAGNISGVILAGGENRRFNGITKSKIVIDGKPIISRILDTINEIFNEIIIVTNSPEEFKEYCNCKIVSDHFLKVGPLGGIHAALKGSSKEALFVFAGDMPLLDKKLILSQINYFDDHKCDILIPRVSQYIEPLHAIYSIGILKTLEDYLGGNQNCAVREFILKVNVRYLELGDSEETRRTFTNINSPLDVLLAEKVLRLH